MVVPVHKSYTIMQWDVSNFGGSQTHKDATLPIVLRANPNGAEGAAEGRCFGHAQTIIGGQIVDIYYAPAHYGHDIYGTITLP